MGASSPNPAPAAAAAAANPVPAAAAAAANPVPAAAEANTAPAAMLGRDEATCAHAGTHGAHSVVPPMPRGQTHTE